MFLNVVEVAYFSTGIVVGIAASMFFLLLLALLAGSSTTEHHYTLNTTDDPDKIDREEVIESLGEIGEAAWQRGDTVTAKELFEYAEALEDYDDGDSY